MSSDDSQSNATRSQDPGQILCRELLRVIEPVRTAIEDGPAGIGALLEDCGVGELLLDEEADKVVTTFDRKLAQPIETVGKVIEGGVPQNVAEGVRDVAELVPAIVKIVDGIKHLNKLEFQAENLDEAGDNLLDYLLIRYLNTYYPDVHAAFAMTGIVEGSPPNNPGEIDLSGLGDVVNDPNAAVRETLGWGATDPSEVFQPHVFLHHLSVIMRSNVAYPFFVETPSDQLKALTEGNVTATQEQVRHQTHPALKGRPDEFDTTLRIPNAPMQTMQLPLLTPPGAEIGLNVTPLPAYNDRLPGLALLPYANTNLSQSGPLWQGQDAWQYEVAFQAEASEWGLGIQPTKSGKTDPRLVELQGTGTSVTGKAKVGPPPSSSTPGTGRILLGSQDASRLELTRLAAGVGVEFEADEGFDLWAELPADARLKVKPKGGFLEKVLPDDITSNFSTTVGWSSKRGLYFDAGATLEVPLPMHQEIGPITLQEIYLSVRPDLETGTIDLEGSAAATVSLGPVTANVERMGVDATVDFPKQRDGNFGPVDLDLGFKPPSGVGLSVDSGPVSGTGYLYFDHERERYAGVAQLKVPKVSLTAVGLITTELPDGSDGFSMQVIVAGQFPPITLGPGITLSGVGGLLGVHRRFRERPLRKVVRKGNLDSVLFPRRETVKNSPQQVISDVRSIFPPKRESYVFGPMVKLGFGTPTVLKSSLGIVLEIPSYRVAILGRFELVLPSHDAKAPSGAGEKAVFPPVVVNMDVVGVVDIPGKSVSIDGRLYDSRIVKWSVDGDLALRSRWGDTSRFILSLGGFHPRYTPPKDAEGLNSMQRLTVSLDVPGGNPVLGFVGYIAATSNTFQIGAQVDASYTLGAFSISGTLGFDALFKFDPTFKFVASFLADFELTAAGFTAAVGVEGTMKGPSPVSISGTFSYQLGPQKGEKDFDVTLGEDRSAEPMPPAEVLPELRGALADSRNWNAQLPNGAQRAVSVHGPESEDGGGGGNDSSGGGDTPAKGPVPAHPRASLTVTQSVVPLEYTVEKFGENTPKTYDRFRIAGASVAGESVSELEPVRTEFPPAKFEQMSDAEKLDSPDFVDETGGVSVAGDDPFVGGAERAENRTRASFVYEERVTDRGLGATDDRAEEVASGTFDHAARTHGDDVARSLVADRSGATGPDGGRFQVGGSERGADGDDGSSSGGGRFGVAAPEYVVVDEDRMETVTLDEETGAGGSGADGVTKATAKRVVRQTDWTDRDEASLSVVRKDRAARAAWLGGGGESS